LGKIIGIINKSKGSNSAYLAEDGFLDENCNFEKEIKIDTSPMKMKRGNRMEYFDSPIPYKNQTHKNSFPFDNNFEKVKNFGESLGISEGQKQNNFKHSKIEEDQQCNYLEDLKANPEADKEQRQNGWSVSCESTKANDPQTKPRHNELCIDEIKEKESPELDKDGV